MGWLGINSNTGGAYLTTVSEFAKYGLLYDRGNGLNWYAGGTTSVEEYEGLHGLEHPTVEYSLRAGMTPIITLEPEGSKLPSTEAEIDALASALVKSIKAAREAFPSSPMLFELINEPYFYEGGTASTYAKIVGATLTACEDAAIPLDIVYVAGGATMSWIGEMYTAVPKLETQVQAWYFHPYGPPSGTVNEGYVEGIQTLPEAREKAKSGRDNIIVSEVGFWTPDVNKGEGKGGPESCWASSKDQAAEWLTEMLKNAVPFHAEGWLRALVVFSRSFGGWAMQYSEEPEYGTLTPSGEAMINFAQLYIPKVTSNRGWTWAVQGTVQVETLVETVIVPAGGERVAIVRLDCRLVSGTSVKLEVLKDGVAVPGLTDIEATTAPKHVTVSAVEVAEGEELTLKVTEASGSPSGLSATVQLQCEAS
ncbi:MAG: hypothetical protein ACYCUM_10260 [Solirubrobacteraceae bacterium]